MMRSARRRINETVRKNRGKIFLLCVFLTSIFVGTVVAIIYNWMYIKGSATIDVVFTFSF